MRRLSPVCFVKRKFGSSDKSVQKIDTNEDGIFQKNSRYTFFDHKSNEEILEDLEVEPVDEQTKKIQIQFATTCNKNEQQQDGKKSAEL
jgi:hypothetical protein